MLGVDLVTEANKEGYDIAAVDRGEHQDLVAQKIARCSAGAALMLRKKGLMDVRVWTRKDTRTVCLKGPGKLGPDVKTIAQRRTYDSDTGKLLLVEDGLPEGRGFRAHREFVGPTNTTTILLYHS